MDAVICLLWSTCSFLPLRNHTHTHLHTRTQTTRIDQFVFVRGVPPPAHRFRPAPSLLLPRSADQLFSSTCVVTIIIQHLTLPAYRNVMALTFVLCSSVLCLVRVLAFRHAHAHMLTARPRSFASPSLIGKSGCFYICYWPFAFAFVALRTGADLPLLEVSNPVLFALLARRTLLPEVVHTRVCRPRRSGCCA